jgi:uncharacterized repeat protein (TIGR01451 family)
MALIASVVVAFISDSGSHTVVVEDSGFSRTADLGNATVEYIGSDADNQSSGTGIFDPFVRLQGSPTEAGYNTDGTVEFQTKTGKWTKAILTSAIPIVDCGGDLVGTDCWELFVDINESNTAKYVSLNEVEVWLTDDPELSGYPTNFNSDATPVYDFSGEILIQDVNQGSGRGDLRYLIPVQPESGDYFVLYSVWGTSAGTAPDGKTWGSEGGFEEWKVRKAPNVVITKTADDDSVNAGENIGFTITVTNNGAAEATGVTFSDLLPAGSGVDWSESPDNPNCSIGGSPPTQTLTCGPVTLAANGGSLSVHVQSATTGASCGTYPNTATITAGGTGSASATITVNCGAIQITKTAKHADTSGDTSANLVATFTITGPSPATTTRTVTTGADGIGCVGGLAFGSYSVAETTAPTGYDAPAATTVTVDNSANCTDATFAGESVNVENTPLTDVDISIDSQHNGATSTTIECWGPDSDPATDPPDYSATVSDGSLPIDDLAPTDPIITLNCQITIDP